MVGLSLFIIFGPTWGYFIDHVCMSEVSAFSLFPPGVFGFGDGL